MQGLAQQEVLFREEFQDVVTLPKVHRVEYDAPDLSPAERERYKEEADRFLEVVAKMADCEWSALDHAWLKRRERSRLRMTPEGRRELEAFDDAPVLMDGKKKKANGEDGADQVNQRSCGGLPPS